MDCKNKKVVKKLNQNKNLTATLMDSTVDLGVVSGKPLRRSLWLTERNALDMILQPRAEVVHVTGTVNTYMGQHNIKEVREKIK